MGTVIIPAAGQGKRMGSDINKVFLPLADKPILLHSLVTFSACPEIKHLIVVSSPAEVEFVAGLLKGQSGLKPWQVVAGGTERQHSIANALQKVSPETEVILVHDGARPLVTKECIQAVIAGANRYQAAIAAVPVKDTIKEVNEELFVTDTPKRHRLWSVQTPQGFKAGLLHTAYEKAAAEGFLGTDDASLVERMGIDVKIINGSYNNIKITTPEDLVIAEALVDKNTKGES